MALLTNKIDDFEFIWLRGNGPEPPKMALSLDERAGVNGTEVHREGIKGRPFTLRSGVDTVDYDAARTLHIDYIALIEGDPVDLVVGGISSTAQGYSVQVLDVRLVYAGTIGGSVGGLLANPEGYLECEWDLIGIPN